MKKQDTTIKFGGRTLMFDVTINTDESVEEVMDRLRVAAQGPKLRMAVVGGRAPLFGPPAIKVWSAVEKMTREQEKALGITDDGEN